MSKPVIAFVTGGYSGEAVISYESAVTIGQNIDREKYDVYKIDIRQDGWWYIDAEGAEAAVDKNDFSIRVNNEKIRFDAALIGIHGTPGEDGKLQGYFDMLQIPYTSCNAAVSALTFNKRYTVAVAAFSGIKVARSVLLTKDRFVSADEMVGKLTFPVFVKPNNGGSSIATSKVNALSDELGAAIEKAFGVDDQVLVEEFIRGRELTIGVFRKNDAIVTLPITEIIPKKEFFDYEAKYLGMSEEVTPAEVEDAIAEKIRQTAKKVYSVFNCRGIVRIDFIYNAEEEVPYMLEINTVPGQSAASIVPQQVRAMGGTLTEFYSALIEDALNSRHV